MEKLKQLHATLQEAGLVPETVDYATFESKYADPAKQEALHGTLQEAGYVPKEVPIEKFKSVYFPTATEGAKKKSGSLISRFWRGFRDGFRRYSNG